MLFRVYTQVAQEVYKSLVEADARTFQHTGSNDDSRLIVGINGKQRPIRSDKYTWASAQNNEWDEKEIEAGGMPAIEEIETAWVLDTFAHYGSSHRSLSVLRVYARSKAGNVSDVFVVFDLGEVGGKDAGNAPFKATSVLEALWFSTKRVRVEAEVENSEELQIGYRSLQEPRWYDGDWKPCNFTAETAQSWLQRAIEEALKVITNLKDIEEKYLTSFRSESTAFEVAQQLWSETALGRLLTALDVS